jgi:hypothetical protein
LLYRCSTIHDKWGLLKEEIGMSSITEIVRDKYAAVAQSGLSNDSTAVKSVAAAFGYSPEDLASLPSEANMGLSCGNPVAMAALRSGEVVVDLGCGGGLDVLLASKLVGSLPIADQGCCSGSTGCC